MAKSERARKNNKVRFDAHPHTHTHVRSLLHVPREIIRSQKSTGTDAMWAFYLNEILRSIGTYAWTHDFISFQPLISIFRTDKQKNDHLFHKYFACIRFEFWYDLESLNRWAFFGFLEVPFGPLHGKLTGRRSDIDRGFYLICILRRNLFLIYKTNPSMRSSRL